MSDSESEITFDDTASKIDAFKKARETEQANFDVYVYRIVQDLNRRVRNPFLTKYENYLPDELEIAEKFRGGRYKLQAIWYIGGKQKSESWSYEIDDESFPVQSAINSLPIKSGSDPTQTLMLLVADIVKSAYTTRAPIENDNIRRDPLELFGEVQGKMQEMYQRMMDIQGNVLERSFQMNLEKRYGLLEDGSVSAAGDDEGEGSGMMESGVIEIVKQIVDGAKLILPLLGLPGTKPVIEGIKSNPAFSKYAELAKNPLIVQEVARALRKEYGDNKAGLLLKSFGINMVARPAPAAPSRAPVQEVPARVVPAGKNKVSPISKKPVKSTAKLSNVKKG
jgi:hypothetical protein